MRVGIVCILSVVFAVEMFDPLPTQAQEAGFFASADWLNLKARRRGMDFVIVDPNSDSNVQGDLIDLNYDRNSGARVVMGYRLGSCWTLAAEYQTFDTNNQRTIQQPAGGSLWATRLHPDSIIGDRFATSVTGNARLDYDVIDFTVSRSFSMDCRDRINFTLFGGFRYGKIGQHLNINYVDSVNSRTADVIDENVLDACGIRAGGQLDANIYGGLSVFGRGAVSVLAARANTHYAETDVSSTSTNELVNIREIYYEAVPVVETAFGVALKRGYWELAGGYELAMWGNVGQRRDFCDDIDEQKFSCSSNDLILDGFFLRLAYNR